MKYILLKREKTEKSLRKCPWLTPLVKKDEFKDIENFANREDFIEYVFERFGSGIYMLKKYGVGCKRGGDIIWRFEV